MRIKITLAPKKAMDFARRVDWARSQNINRTDVARRARLVACLNTFSFKISAVP